MRFFTNGGSEIFGSGVVYIKQHLPHLIVFLGPRSPLSPPSPFPPFVPSPPVTLVLAVVVVVVIVVVANELLEDPADCK